MIRPGLRTVKVFIFGAESREAVEHGPVGSENASLLKAVQPWSSSRMPSGFDNRNLREVPT